MNEHQIQNLSQAFNILFAVVLIVCAVRILKKSVGLWILCVVVAVAVAQQISKQVQHARVLGPDFPSTHFAVALGIAGAYWALSRRFIPATAVYLVVYGGLILWQHYHTQLEMAGAVYALPMGYFAGRFGTRPQKIASS